MGSRLKEDVNSIFICFCEVAQPDVSNQDGWIIQKFPDDYGDTEILKAVPVFTFPCEFEQEKIQHFSFVLTNADSKWTFGFCRHDPKTSTSLVFLSYLPWGDIFIRLLNTIADLIRSCEANDLREFLEFVMKSELPEQGTKFPVKINQKLGTFSCTIPDPRRLPTIPENKNLTEYYSAVDTNNMLVIFASMLCERRIVFISRKPHRLSACVQAANLVIYPMSWQHIFIPILPRQLSDYLLAPMPYIIGVPTSTWEATRKTDIGDVVVLDADTNQLHTPFNDVDELPPDVTKFLKTRLKNQADMLDDGFARAFLKALVQLIGGYRDALKFQQGQEITFNPEAFIESRPPSMQKFLRRMLDLQIFQQFKEERLARLNSGLGFSDEFEFEACNYLTKSATQDQYKEWISNMKKQGTVFFKSVKNKANPAVRSAVKSVKERGKDVKSAYKGIRTRMRKDGHSEPHKSEAGMSTFHRTRPLTVGPPVTTFKKPRAASTVINSRSNEYVPLGSPTDTTSPPVEEELPPAPRLDMDLLGDIQEMINRKCSILDSSPPSDRTLKAVPSLEGFHRIQLPARHTPLTHSLSSPPVAATNPFAFTFHQRFPSFPFSSENATTPCFSHPNLYGLEKVLDPCYPSTACNPPVSSQCNGSKDLIRLDSEPSEAAGLNSPDDSEAAGNFSRDSSDESIKFKTGLSNPLYPFYSIPNNSNTTSKAVQSQSEHPQPTHSYPYQSNNSFVHTNLSVKNANFNEQDMDLLKEYGMDFKADTASLSLTPNSNSHSVLDPFELPYDSNLKRTTQSTWTTFE